MKHIWTDEERKAQGERMRELHRLGKIPSTRAKWSEERKEKQRKFAKKWWKEHRDEYTKHLDISVSQTEDNTTYQREYQRKWRETHKDYYKLKQRERSNKEKEML